MLASFIAYIPELFNMVFNQFFSSFLAFFFMGGNICNLIILILGYINCRRQYAASNADLIHKLQSLRILTPISILMPCYNEEKSIVDSIHSMFNLEYPDIEIVVCNDGSKDNSLQILIDEFDLVAVNLETPMILSTMPVRQTFISRSDRRLFVIDKDNGGKADALNACINFSRNPLVCCVDSDSLLDSDGLVRVALPFLNDPDRTIAVGGTISIISGNGNDFNRSVPFTIAGMVQSVEYLRAFLVGRMGWDYLGCTTIISGAFGLFKKSILIKVGGYTRESIGEDMELLLRLHDYCKEHKEQYRVHFLPDPVCWTEAPSDFETLGKQRSRWQQGLCDSLWRTRSLMFKKGGGKLSWIALPYLLFFEAIAPLIESFSYFLLALAFVMGWSVWHEVVLLAAVTNLFGIVMNFTALVIDQLTFTRYTAQSDLLKLMIGSVVEQIGYRQLHLYWRVRGMYRWARGGHSWGDMKRKGFRSGAPSTRIKASQAGLSPLEVTPTGREQDSLTVVSDKENSKSA
ncbi:MAG: glycosyltransferase family 2 protein [Oligoflexus sp.]|nr:glycosyltransferase family 2 protein [Oligoflexus sp.]